MVRTLLLLIAIYAGYRLYKRLFLEKRCPACGKQIQKEAAICYHCNTIQADGIIIESGNVSSDVKVTSEASKPFTGFVKRLQSPVALVTLSIIATMIVAGIYLFTEQ